MFSSFPLQLLQLDIHQQSKPKGLEEVKNKAFLAVEAT
jgi:hypothetical protein